MKHQRMNRVVGPQLRSRIWYAALVATVVCLGLASRRFAGVLPGMLHKNTGDILWATMVFLLFAFLLPRSSTFWIAMLSAIFSVCIEFGKFFHASWFDPIRATTVGRLVFGYSFSWSNLICYAVGIGLGVGIELLPRAMKQARIRPNTAFLFCVCLLVLTSPGRTSEVNVILDTDIGPDCDDVGAVCVLHALADRGEAHILAMMCDTGSEWGAPCLDALNTYFGRPGIPVGTLKGAAGFLEGSAYNRILAERYPHRLQSGGDAPDATVLYRQILAAQPDGSVSIAAIGPLRNLSHLLNSEPDRFSPLTGRQLVAKKVKLLSCMGGLYPRVPQGSGPEWNFAQDENATRDVCENWPTPILFSGGEIGSGLMTGRRVAVDAPEYHPLTLAFALSPDVGFGGDRPTWDETAALAVVRGVRDYWKASTPGINRAGVGGTNTLTTDLNHGHRYLQPLMPASQLESVIEDLMVSARSGPLHFDYDITTYCAQGFGNATASDTPSGTRDARSVFSRNPENVWVASSRNGWVEYDCPDGRKIVVSKYRFVSADGSPENDPYAWMLYGYHEESARWQRLDLRVNHHFANRRQRSEFVVKNPGGYNRYRFLFAGAEPPHLAGIALLESIDNAAGVRVRDIQIDHHSLTVPVAGRAALNATVLPSNAMEKTIVWSSSHPSVATVKRIGKNTAVISGIAVGTCTIQGTTQDGHKVASCRVHVEPSTLPHDWVYEEVNAPHVPGCALFQEGTFTVTGGGLAIERWWQRVWDQFAFVSRPVNGDGVITARLTSQMAGDRRGIAGVMFRETLARDSRFALLGRHPNGDLFLRWRDTAADEGTGTSLGQFALPVWLKLERHGATFTAYLSKDGTYWGKPAATHTGTLAVPLAKVGECVTAGNNTMTSTATFDHVTVETLP